MQTKSGDISGKRILLISSPNIDNSLRIKEEIRLLQSQGAIVDMVSQRQGKATGEFVNKFFLVSAFEDARFLPASQNPKRIPRILSNLLRNTFRSLLTFLSTLVVRTPLQEFLTQAVSQYDIFWVYDAYGLPSAAKAKRMNVGDCVYLIYETQDLVPEYDFNKAQSRLRRIQERLFLRDVDAMVTAGESYAAYYRKRYSRHKVVRNILVRPNIPPIVIAGRPATAQPYSLVFYGNLAVNRPIATLLKAFAEVEGDYTVTFIGENRVGSELEELIRELKLSERVFICDPVGPYSGVQKVSDYDFGLVALDGSNENERRAPTSKLCTYMAAGLAIIASDLQGIRMQAGSELEAIYVQGRSISDWQTALQSAVNATTTEIDKMKASSLSRAHNLKELTNDQDYVDIFSRAGRDWSI